MATRGRKPKPTEAKRRAGNPGNRPLNNNEPTPPAGAPDCPEHIAENAAALKAWEWLCSMLETMGLLASSDVALMTIYCDTWAEYVKCRRDVNQFGMVLMSPKTNMPFCSPYVAVESMLKKQLMGCLTELGLSPTSRTRLHVDSKPPAEDGKGRFFNPKLKVVG